MQGKGCMLLCLSLRCGVLSCFLCSLGSRLDLRVWSSTSDPQKCLFWGLGSCLDGWKGTVRRD